MIVVTMLATSTTTSIGAAVKTEPRSNLLRDGGFEFPPMRHGDTSGSSVSATTSGRWHVTSGIVAVASAFPVFETPPVGAQVLRLMGVPSLADGAICQPVVGMLPGVAYRLRFLAASMIQESIVDVTLGSTAVAHLDLAGRIPAQFHAFRYTVTARSTVEMLCLHGTPYGENSFPLIDAIRLQPE